MQCWQWVPTPLQNMLSFFYSLAFPRLDRKSSNCWRIPILELEFHFSFYSWRLYISSGKCKWSNMLFLQVEISEVINDLFGITLCNVMF